MADTDKLNSVASAELEGEKVSANHSEETYALIAKAREELKNWLPQWGKKPFVDTQAREEAHRLHEENVSLGKPYQLPNQHKLTNEKERVRNLMHINEFCRKLNNILGPANDGGSRIFINTPPPTPGMDEQLKGLFIKMRGMDNFIYHTDLPSGWKKICAVQTPFMSEWGVLRVGEHEERRGWKYIGWRGQVLLRLILSGAITEAEAHAEFGTPQGVDVDREYLQILTNWRNRGRTEAIN